MEVQNQDLIQTLKEKKKTYYEQHKERLRQQSREYFYKHREKYKAYSAEYWKTNKEKLNEKRKQKQLSKPPRIRADLTKPNAKNVCEARRLVYEQIVLSPPEPEPNQEPVWMPKPEDFEVRFD